jgi:thioredoxin 1
MTSLTLQHDNRRLILDELDGDVWIVACLCAAWCDVCASYRAGFDSLAELHADVRFIWIDIEDHADVVGDFDVDNFPTLLIQKNDAVAFFGTVQPDWRQAARLLQAQRDKTVPELARHAQEYRDRLEWNEEGELRQRLRAVV